MGIKIMKGYKVVRILDEYRIIINAGSENHITLKDYFEIRGVIDDVYDPDTQELLGKINGVKAKVKPIEIQQKMCICQNIENVPLNQLDNEILAAFNPSPIFHPSKLNVEKSQITNPELYTPIKVGDEVVLVQGHDPSQPCPNF